MSIDGAFQGMPADAAMHAVIGGADPADPPPATKEEVRARVLAATWDPKNEDYASGNGYGRCADFAAKMILQAVEGNPTIPWETIPTERQYAYLDSDGHQLPKGDYNGTWSKVGDGWDDYLQQVWGPEELAEWDALGLSGFQWGWAVNTVRWIVGMPPVGNPAILTIGGSDD